MPSFWKGYNLWCVVNLFQTRSAVESYEALEGTTTEGGKFVTRFEGNPSAWYSHRVNTVMNTMLDLLWEIWNDEAVMPVAVLRQCEEVLENRRFVVVGEDLSNSTSSRVVIQGGSVVCSRVVSS